MNQRYIILICLIQCQKYDIKIIYMIKLKIINMLKSIKIYNNNK